MSGEREAELLDLIEAYWRIKRPPRPDGSSRVSRDGPEIAEPFVWVQERDDVTGTDRYERAWAESEACLREVAGECAVRSASVGHYCDAKNTHQVDLTIGDRTFSPIDFKSRSVALLRAFVAAFKEPPK
jgi:hypothetical protein